MKKINPTFVWPCAILSILYLTAVFFRPLFPIDETRYMTVAWEMRLHDGWLSPLTLNFDPYSHKPPMLFWLINIFWSVFGISRWAGLIPAVLSSLAVVFLTIKLGKKLIPANQYDPLKIALLMLGSFPLLIYGTLVLFDLSLTVWVLASLLCLLAYTEKRAFIYIVAMGLCMGLGVLTKGPVAYLYILCPALLAPLWQSNFHKPLQWYTHILTAIIISALPVSLWLIPVLSQSDNHFAFWLVWNQTAGRVTGNFSEAHVRPFYFYLPLLPLMMAPWIFFPNFWKNLKTIDVNSQAIRFLLCWVIPVFIAFSFVSGKQPHYLVPLLPGVSLLIYVLLKEMTLKHFKITVLTFVFLFAAGQIIASQTIFRNYDLVPTAEYIQNHQQHDWAFVRNYHGEFGYLSRLEKPMKDLELNQLDDWFKAHPDGKAVIRYANEDDVKGFHKITSRPYRSKNMGIFERQREN